MVRKEAVFSIIESALNQVERQGADLDQRNTDSAKAEISYILVWVEKVAMRYGVSKVIMLRSLAAYCEEEGL